MFLLPIEPDDIIPAIEWEDGEAMIRYFKAQAMAAKSNELYFFDAWQATGEPQFEQAYVDAGIIALAWECDLIVAEYVVRVADTHNDDFPF